MTKIKLPNGVIDPGDPSAQEIGFFPELFDGYLSVEGERVYISSIWSKKPGKGNFKTLVENIEAAGYKVVVPCPLPDMVAILSKWGFVSHPEFFEIVGESIDVWERA